jgi:dipeptidyl-peptidase-4
MAELSFPRQYARTLRFTLGEPRTFTVAPDGSRVVFLRSRAGDDRAQQLWVVDLPAGNQQDRGGRSAGERLVASADELLSNQSEDLTAAERARRERSREGSAGIVGYATDEAVQTAAFALSGRLFSADLLAATTVEIPAATPVSDPRPSPDGRQVAYVCDNSLRLVATDGSGDRALAEPDGDNVSWGLAEFIAAEEMSRFRGFWWSPASDAVLAARVDESPVGQWWIADPANPDQPPTQVRYPAAGTANADVTLALLGLDGSRIDVSWDREAFPYLAAVHWSSGRRPLLHVLSRDQRSARLLSVDTTTGDTATEHAEEDDDWLDLFDGVPAWTPDGRLVHIADRGNVRVLTIGGRAVTDSALHVRSVLDVGEDSVLVQASAGDAAGDAEIGELHVYRVSDGGVERVSDGAGVHSAARAGTVTVLSTSRPDLPGTRATIVKEGAEPVAIASFASEPVLTAHADLVVAGERRIPCAVLLPSGYLEGSGPLPVLMDPYGGPHGQRVVAAHNAHLVSQWFADQGFAVIVADGRGTPGRSPAWEKAVRDDFAGPILDDQIAALHALAERYPLDLGRVAIRGWSFGGYLSGLAVLRRPDVFHAGVAGAPVTDQRLYDTCYEERYLGDPNVQPEVYARNSLVADDGLVEAADTVRPLLVIHGLADDNVVVAHSLRLSSALLAAGRHHEVLPLSGVTHMATQEEVAENLLLHQVEFLKRSLATVEADHGD